MRLEEDRFHRYFGDVKNDLSTAELNILNKEYEFSSKAIEAQKEGLAKVTNLVIALSSIIPPTFIYLIEKNLQNEIFTPSLFIIIILFFSIQIVQLSHQNRIIFRNAQKLIITRRALQLNFNFYHPIIPKNTVEGARNPFEIKLFNGFFSHEISPLTLLCIIGTLFLYYVLRLVFISNNVLIPTLAFFFFLLYLIRKLHLNTYENLDQLFIKFCSIFFLNLKLEESFGWIIYRVQLSTSEVSRLKINTKHLKRMLIFMEDRRFYKHCGFSSFSILRAAYNRLLTSRTKSGASTITQQLVRSLFIIDYQKTKRRKLIEILLASLWMEKKFSKDEIIDFYISSVRYEKNILGVASALNFFFDKKITEISVAQAFFLAERVANINSKLLTNRINSYLNQAIEKKLISEKDIGDIFLIYNEMISKKKITTTDDELRNWKFFLQATYSF